jgi:uncharacterized membrane protein
MLFAAHAQSVVLFVKPEDREARGPFHRGHGERQPMKQVMVLVSQALVRGLLIILPVYLAVLVLLKAMQSVTDLVRPFMHLLPGWISNQEILALLLILAICLAIGAAVGTRIGQRVRNWFDKTIFEKIPGYALLRSLTQQVAGQSRDGTWKFALFESDDALVPAFIIEEFADGRYTVFVPSIPTPFSGAVYICDRNRVHPVDVPFTEAVKVISRWGSGAKDLVAAMEARTGNSTDEPGPPQAPSAARTRAAVGIGSTAP